jgi:peptide/histidine transporter 3/4
MLNFVVYIFCAKWYKYRNDVSFDREMLLKHLATTPNHGNVSGSSVSRLQDIPLNEEE